MERVIAGPQRKSRVMTEQRAHHHCLPREWSRAGGGTFLSTPIPCTRFRSSARGQALGYTMQLPTEDHFLKTKNEMLDELAVFLGGRVAEELMCDDITSGCVERP